LLIKHDYELAFGMGVDTLFVWLLTMWKNGMLMRIKLLLKA